MILNAQIIILFVLILLIVLLIWLAWFALKQFGKRHAVRELPAFYDYMRTVVAGVFGGFVVTIAMITYELLQSDTTLTVKVFYFALFAFTEVIIVIAGAETYLSIDKKLKPRRGVRGKR